MFDMKVRRLAVVGLVLAGFALAGCSSPQGAATAPPQTTVSCVYAASGTAAKPVTMPPTQGVPSSGTVTMVLHMTAGDVPITLDRADAPCAVNSLVSLAQQSYFDNTNCHRLVPDFVLQCGDPTGTGMGGPGYKFADELTGQEKYPVGTIAMANAGANTNGSQFFIVIGSQAASLPPSYDVLGQVSTAGMTVIQAIAAQGGTDPTNPQGSPPAEGGHIATATVG